MNREGAQERIRKMIDIIYDEAHDKAKKTREQTSHQYNIEKNKILNQQKDKVIQEFKNKLEQYSVQRRIERSTKVNASRLKKMQARQDTIYKVKDDAAESLRKVTNDTNKYRELVKNLIVQGLVRLMERDVDIRCRKQDVGLVEAVLPDAAREFSELIKRETNYDFVVRLYVDTHHYLREDSIGGVILHAQGGSILCHNTLDARLELCYQDSLPNVREGLFQ